MFDRKIGFSGTPNELLPVELGKCQFEASSDARILSALTSPDVVTVTMLLEPAWSSKSLLEHVAKLDPQPAALIDTGALITGLSNQEVAQQLLLGLTGVECVVFINDEDKAMALLPRKGGSGFRVLCLEECSVPLNARFTFYDHVHTTGTKKRKRKKKNKERSEKLKSDFSSRNGHQANCECESDFDSWFCYDIP